MSNILIVSSFQKSNQYKTGASLKSDLIQDCEGSRDGDHHSLKAAMDCDSCESTQSHSYQYADLDEQLGSYK